MFAAGRVAVLGLACWLGAVTTAAQAAGEAAKSEVPAKPAPRAAAASETAKPDASAKPVSRAATAGDTSKPEGLPKLAPRAAAANDNKAPAPSDIQRQFCFNNAASANDARLAWQAAQLSELEARLKQRIADLEAKRAEYVEWVRKRDEAMSKAADNVVTIYARMKPDAAALQIAAMEDPMAAALLAKLNARSASAILNEMEPGRAARLTNAMVGPTGSDKKKT